MTPEERAAVEINLTPPITDAELAFAERAVIAACVSPVWDDDGTEDPDGHLEAAREIRYQACAVAAIMREAIAADREACAQEAEVGRAGGERPDYADEIAAAIRART